MLDEVYGEECILRARIFEQHKWFCSGREDDDHTSGRPIMSFEMKTAELLRRLTESDWHHCFQEWQQRRPMQQCVDAEGNYFDGD